MRRRKPRLSLILAVCLVALIGGVAPFVFRSGGRLSSFPSERLAAASRLWAAAGLASRAETGSARSTAQESQEAQPTDMAPPTETPVTESRALFGSPAMQDIRAKSEQTQGVAESLLQTFEDAETAFARQEWIEALSLYEQIRSVDGSYENQAVRNHLAIAYRSAAAALIEDSSADVSDLEMARRYLSESITLNPEDTAAADEKERLERYLAGVRPLQLGAPQEAIDLLLPLYEAHPDFLNGQAAEQLYGAFVALGDVAYRRGEVDVARQAYERAQALDLAAMDAADLRLASISKLLDLTPTPAPLNLATVQAAAVARRLPPVLLATPTPANPAEATGQAEYATGVAVTTGTFTPGPKEYVTPFVVLPSPPAENLATEAARVLQANAREGLIPTPTSTPMPYNAVLGEYVYATQQPENAATAEALAVIAEANRVLYGAPTPLPWNAVVITQVPTPLPTIVPTSTPVPLLVPESVLTPTPTPPATETAPDTMPAEVRNKIVFLSDRGGDTQTYILDPATGDVSLVTQAWVHPMASKNLGLSPDGNLEAIVLADNNRILQIQVRDHAYDAVVRQLTAVRNSPNPAAIAYDPAWSPQGDLVAYVSSEFSGDEIYTVNVVDGSIRRLTENAWEWDKHPTWSPDGSQIVFYSNRQTGRSQLWIMNSDGSDQRNLSSNEYNDWDPVWIR